MQNNQNLNKNNNFSQLRALFFPIHNYEIKKVIPMALIFFFILFNYTCLRNIKDALIVTSAGAEILSFLKLFCVTPSAIIFMILYLKASDIFSNEKLFYITLTPFIVFFGLFGYVLYPLKHILHPSIETIKYLQYTYPSLKWFFLIYANWTYAIFYVLAEIWGSAILSLSFWQFANQICKTSEAKRFYSFFSFIGQLSMLAAGGLGSYFSNISKYNNSNLDPWAISLYWLMGLVVGSGILTMLIYKWIYQHILTDKNFYDKPYLPGVSKKKRKTSLLEGVKTILTSPYLGLIAILVIAYGTSVNFIEALWKSQLKLKFITPNEYNLFMNKFTFYTGVTTMIMLLVGSNILRLFQWITAAIITPLVMLFGGGLFFSFIIFKGKLNNIISIIGTNPIYLSILIGGAVIVIAKATKYALFDLTKEMAYIPLDENLKVKGKAAVDVVGGRLGKSLGAGYQAFLLSIMTGSTYSDLSIIIGISFIVICLIWIFAVKLLSKRMNKN